jgi:nucleotide-binding universal stress UspA family protein
VTLEEMDLPAILRRHPQLCLIDELAHTNVQLRRALTRRRRNGGGRGGPDDRHGRSAALHRAPSPTGLMLDNPAAARRARGARTAEKRCTRGRGGAGTLRSREVASRAIEIVRVRRGSVGAGCGHEGSALEQAIVAGYDGSHGARDAVALGVRLAASTGRALTLVCVRPPRIAESADGSAETERFLTATEAQRALDAAPVAPEVARQVVEEESVAHGLHRFAEGVAASAIVVGCPERTSPGRIETGTVAERLLHGSPCAVALAPRGYEGHTDEGFKRIMVAYAPSDEARAALRTAAGLARAGGATVRVVSVVGAPPAWKDERPSYEDAAREILRSDLDRSLRALASTVAVEGEVLEGDPVERLLERASGWADLIVTGSRGHGPERRVLLGSVSSGLLERAAVPVIVTPRGAESELADDAPPSSADTRRATRG